MTTATISKKQIAASIYAALKPQGGTRKDIMAAFVKETGMSFACATTYYGNFHANIWAPVVPVAIEVQEVEAVVAPVVEVVDYEAMSNKQLVALYNEKAEKPVVKFRDHATAVARTAALYV